MYGNLAERRGKDQEGVWGKGPQSAKKGRKLRTHDNSPISNIQMFSGDFYKGCKNRQRIFSTFKAVPLSRPQVEAGKVRLNDMRQIKRPRAPIAQYSLGLPHSTHKIPIQ